MRITKEQPLPRRMMMPTTLVNVAPNRVWERSVTGRWYSRPWNEGEKAAYLRVIRNAN